MSAREYRFVSVWRIPAGSDAVWSELTRLLDAGASPTWWPAVTVVQAPPSLTVGGRLTFRVRSPLGYALVVRMTITGLDVRRRLDVSSVGDLDGTGSLTIAESAPRRTSLTWTWEVWTRKRWMNATGAVLGPAFRLAHERVMQQGERGLRTALTRC